MQTKGAWKECHVMSTRRRRRGKVNILRLNNAPQRDSRRAAVSQAMRTSLEQEVKCPCDEGYPRSSCCKAFSRRRNGALFFFSLPRGQISLAVAVAAGGGGLSRGRGGGGARLSTRPRSIAPLLLSIFARFGTMFIPPFPSLGVFLQKGRSPRPQERPCERGGSF